MKSTRFFVFAALASCLPFAAAQAQNTVTVLQFGGVSRSSTTQVGATSNTATTLQFGSVNWASATQSGPTSPTTVNNSTIGQSGSLANFATVAQGGWSNTSTVGQISPFNTGAIGQMGIVNNSLVIQQVP